MLTSDVSRDVPLDRVALISIRVCSFAIVIQQLPNELKDPVCIFYLVLRALDTVEDDMAIDSSVKLPILESFHQKIYDRQATLPKLAVSKSARL